MTPAQPRVFVVDDEPFHLLFLGGLLRTAGHAVETFERPEALVARLSPSDRGCVVLDLQMPQIDGLALQRILGAGGVLLPMIFVSGRAGVPSAVEAMKLGALDFLEKPVDPERLRAVVARALGADAEASREREARARARARLAVLSPREREICRLCARGLINKQIAAELGVAESTLQPQRVRVFQKLEVATVADLMRLMALAGEGS